MDRLLQNAQRSRSAISYEANDFGCVESFDAIKQDPYGYAETFSEGSPSLKNLLLQLWTQDIETVGCCTGHKDVHYYLKKPLFGKEEFIDEQTYLAHAKSKRYRHLITDETAYLAFKPGPLGTPDTVRERMDNRLRELGMKTPFHAENSPRFVTIFLDHYVSPQERERFFFLLSHILVRDLEKEKQSAGPIHSKDPGANAIVTKPSLDSVISQAAGRAGPQNKNLPVKGRDEFSL